MKKILISCVAIVLLFHQARSQSPNLVWSNPIEVADASTYGASWPRIVLADGDVPVVMWGRPSSGRVFVSRLNGGSFTTPLNIVPGGVDAFIQNWAGPDLASAGDSVFVTFKAEPTTTGRVYVVRSLDGGLTFGDTVRADYIGSDISDFPAIEVGPGGNPVVAFMRSGPGFVDPEYEVARSTDGGGTFLPPVPGSNSAPGEVCDCCPTSIEVRGDLQLLPFRNNNGNIRETWMAVSTNAGLSYDTVYRMDTTAWMLNACPSQGPDVTVAGDTIVSVWMSAASGNSQVWATAMDLNTMTVAWQKKLDSGASGAQTRPRIVATGDTLGAIWEDTRNGNPDCYFVASIRGPSGLLVGGVNAVDPDSARQDNPDLAYANGVFHIVYRDPAHARLVYRTATIDGLLDREKGIAAENFKVFPNPSTGHFSLDIPASLVEGALFRLYDLQGRLLLEKETEGRVTPIDAQDLKPGIYLGRLQSGGQTMQQKVIIY
jgi:hypothetical protein